MNLQLQRKQVMVLGLAMALAVASYWIPISEPLPTPITQNADPQAQV